ncbi:peptide ABC transporter substrate-binding protein [Aneurinibacillus terranovensis]|uniref:peptide ABC transporter substrate-binding protein n=1 Tax=Aneurinibacillus terranovensis TaxID=278991 RepID=UPI000414B8FA|nr:peptide ABC transporter substrate-binding protein [Aneurinibacillus terranovensis]
MKKAVSILFSFLLVMMLLITGCSSNEAAGGKESAQSKNQDSKFLYLNNMKEPTSLDPPIGFDQVSYDILNNEMEGLTRLGKNHTPEAATAEKWDISKDGKTYTFHIRQNAKWSDGSPVTAGDFAYAWKRLLDPKTASQAAPLAYIIDGGEAYNTGKGSADGVKVKAVNDQTLQVTLAKPQRYLLSLVSNPAFFPVPKAVAEKDPKWAGEAKTLVANGPFKITEWAHDDHIKMVKNENYWDAANVKIDGVIWKMVNDLNTEYQLYQTGALTAAGDAAGLPGDLSDQLFASGKVKVEDNSGTYFFRFNTKMKPFDNADIRRAFSMAIDRQAMVDKVVKGKQKPATAFVAYGLKDAAGKDFREAGGDLIKYDPQEAKKLLQKGMAEEGITSLPPITLTYNSNDLHQKIAEAMQEMFKENLGADVKLASMEWKVLVASQKKLQLQFSRSSFLADFADPINFLDGFQTGNPMNRTGWSSPQYDTLIKEAYNQPDESKRLTLLHNAEKILMDESPILPLYFYNKVYVQSDKVDGIIRHPVGYIDLKWASFRE